MQKLGLNDLRDQDPESYNLVLKAKALKFNEDVTVRNKDSVTKTIKLSDIAGA